MYAQSTSASNQFSSYTDANKLAKFTTYPDDDIKPLNAKRQEDFIWIYENISPKNCEQALKSQYGHEAPFHFANLVREIEFRKEGKEKEMSLSQELEAALLMSGHNQIGLVA